MEIVYNNGGPEALGYAGSLSSLVPTYWRWQLAIPSFHHYIDKKKALQYAFMLLLCYLYTMTRSDILTTTATREKQSYLRYTICMYFEGI